MLTVNNDSYEFKCPTPGCPERAVVGKSAVGQFPHQCVCRAGHQLIVTACRVVQRPSSHSPPSAPPAPYLFNSGSSSQNSLLMCSNCKQSDMLRWLSNPDGRTDGLYCCDRPSCRGLSFYGPQLLVSSNSVRPMSVDDRIRLIQQMLQMQNGSTTVPIQPLLSLNELQAAALLIRFSHGQPPGPGELQAAALLIRFSHGQPLSPDELQAVIVLSQFF